MDPLTPEARAKLLAERVRLRMRLAELTEAIRRPYSDLSAPDRAREIAELLRERQAAEAGLLSVSQALLRQYHAGSEPHTHGADGETHATDGEIHGTEAERRDG